PLEYWELGFQLAIGFSPYDIVYDAASLLAGKDIITGDELTDFDKFAIALGVFTVIGDDLLKLGKKVSQLDNIKKAGNVTSALDTGRRMFSNFRKKGIRGGLADLSARLGQKMKGFFGDVRQFGKDAADGSIWRTLRNGPDNLKPVRKVNLNNGSYATRARFGRQVPGTTKSRVFSDSSLAARQRFGKSAGASFEKFRATKAAATRLPTPPVLRPLPLSKEIAYRAGDIRKAAGRVWREGWRSNIGIDALVGAGTGFAFEGYRQWQNGELNEKDLLLAMGTGVVLGGSVGVRKKVTGESYGMAFGQVAAGAGFNVAALEAGPPLAGGSVSASDRYIAAMFGGVASPVTHLTERGFGGIIPNQRVSEAVADALVGAAFTGSQYIASTGYKGESISRAAALSNFVGGGIGAGWASLVPPVRIKHPQGRKFANDFAVPGIGTLIGGGFLPPIIENYGVEGLYIPPVPQSLMEANN
ncbi:MAG: hypothetical protein GY796_28730, partial [Chloroflexi bacterium]|nr:hypothetical protein [Chloroflexota bacterium]